MKSLKEDLAFLTKQKNIFYIGIIFFNDILVFYFTLVLAFYVRKSLNLSFLPDFSYSLLHFLKMVWIPLIFFFFLIYEKTYDFTRPFLVEFKNLIKVNLFTFIVLFIVIAITKKYDQFSRLMIFIHFFFLLISLPLSRYLIRRIFQQNLFVKKCMFVGKDDINSKNLTQILHSDYGYIVEKNISMSDKYEDKVKSLNTLKDEILAKGISVLILDKRVFNTYDFSLYLIKLRSYVEEILLFDPDFKHSLVNFEQIWFPHTEFLLLKFKSGLEVFFNQVAKRCLDILLLLVILPFFVVLFVILALIIKLDSPGPVLFKQKRVGKRGKEFEIYKFRTMWMDAEERLEKCLNDPVKREEWECYRKLKDDPRITRVGRFLRRFSLDELPQIINVLKGEMSFIGPRPVTQEELELYYKEYAEIYKEVLPGITGYWQVSGRNEIDYTTRVVMDVFYVLNWSIWLDLYILLKTIPAILSGKGAY